MAHQRWLGEPQKDGRSLAAHLTIAARLDPRAAADLAGPPFPQQCAYVWTWFCELNDARPSSSSSMVAGTSMATTIARVPISFTEIRNWASLTGRRLRPWEVDLLRALDVAWLDPGKKHGGGDGAQR